LFWAQHHVLAVLVVNVVVEIWRVFPDNINDVTLGDLKTSVLEHDCSAGIWLVLTPHLYTAVASCEMLDLLVAIDLQLLAKGYFTDQNDLTCLFAARIVHGEISAVTDGFVESICEIETISEQSSASVLAVDNLHAFGEDANKVLNRGAVEEQLLLC